VPNFIYEIWVDLLKPALIGGLLLAVFLTVAVLILLLFAGATITIPDIF